MSDAPCPQPPLARRPMLAEAWVASPVASVLQRAVRGGPARAASDQGDRRPLMLRRLILIALVLFGAWVGTQAMAQVLPEHGTALAEKAVLVLFGLLFAWISAGFWTGVLGAWVLLRGPGRGPLMRGLRGEPVRPLDPAARTAIVMPICNEHVPTVFGGLAATIDSLVATGESEHFDVYVLSDTSAPDIKAAEQAAWSDLAARIAASDADAGGRSLHVHYRWRQRRTQRKAGNVADFCRRWGGAYRYFVVMDADSIMTGECLTTLVRTMEAHPDAGIVQTAPRAVGHETFHARVQQFGAGAYGPLFTAGMRFWQLGESHYWGHNAILRMVPFLAHCGLAELPGSGPLGGEILSHDFVEAALMRRAGWKVWVADEIEGSYEQVPPNLLAELQRDRRWCQGNLQNSRLMLQPGLHAVHRTAFVTGVLAYASSPFWLAFLLLSTLLFAQHAGAEPTYFLEPYQLFPIWPTADLKLMLTLFGLTGVLLLAPKAMSLAAIVLRGRAGRFGGMRRLLASAFIEFLHSLLLAPVRMVFHTQFVFAALTGWRLDWKSPPRDNASTSWREAARRHGLHTALALLWIVVIVFSSDAFAWWLSPILAGLLAAAPLSVWGSRVAAGRALRRQGLLLTPEETRPPRILGEAARIAVEVGGRLVSWHGAFVEPAQAARVLGAAPHRPPASAAQARALARLVEQALADGPAALDDAARLRLLSHREASELLGREVAAHRANPAWWVDGPVPTQQRPAASPAVAVPAAFRR